MNILNPEYTIFYQREPIPDVGQHLMASMQSTAVPSDWIFLPMVQLYNQSLNL